MRHTIRILGYGWGFVFALLSLGDFLQARTVDAEVQDAEMPIPRHFSLPLSFGCQVGLLQPMGRDLSLTTGDWPGLNLGVHADYPIDTCWKVRSRTEVWFFSSNHQNALTTVGDQRIDTKVFTALIGADGVFRPNENAWWGVGAGIHLAYWKVDTKNTIIGSDGSVASASGSPSWTRPAYSLTGTARLAKNIEGEIRWVSSRYGYEDLPTRLIIANVLWRF